MGKYPSGYQQPQSNQSGGLTLTTLISLILALLIYVIGFYPIIRDICASVTGVDSITSSVLAIVPACFLIGLIIAIFQYAFGRRPEGVWGNM